MMMVTMTGEEDSDGDGDDDGRIIMLMTKYKSIEFQLQSGESFIESNTITLL
jgi:hypothetical protein